MPVSVLPIEPILATIDQHLADQGRLILTAEPGAGKTTRVPLALLNASWLDGRQIILLEPRRLAARNAATFMASQLGEAVGETVGYRIRLEQKSSARTRILVVTEGILTRMLQADPELAGVGLIIFDEFHERHLHSDLALALSHQTCELLRPDLRLLVMSATLDTDALGSALGAPLLHCPGRGYPVTTHYRPALNNNERLADQVVRVVAEALRQPLPTNSPGHLLVFLPGSADIRRCTEQLLAMQADQRLPPTLAILPLHGQLDDREQKQALAPAATGVRKILLATNIAESSLTLDGVAIVIDSGLERRMEFSPASGLSQLQTRAISQASSVQRQGRAGRQTAGSCYRLWPEQEQHRRDAHIQPEISHQDLTSLQLELLNWGADVDELLWLTPPPPPALNQACDLLCRLGFIEATSQPVLTDHGRRCASAGIEPRWAHALVLADRAGMGQAAAALIALIQDGGRSSASDDDLERRYLYSQRQPFWNSRIQPLAQRWIKQLQLKPDQQALDIGLVLAYAFPDRIARLRNHSSNRYQLSNGSGAELAEHSALQGQTWLALAELTGGSPNRIRLAAPLDDNRLQLLQQQQPHLFREQIEIDWQDNGTLLAEQQVRLGQLVWQRRKLPQLSREQWHQAWQQWLASQSVDSLLRALDWSDECRALQARIQLAGAELRLRDPACDWPDVSDAALHARAGALLRPWLDSVRSLRDLARLPMLPVLMAQLDWNQQQQLQSLTPETLKVPSGSRISIDYTRNPPVLAVKLQEMFGARQHPAILDGRLPLCVHLLSPARRPVQVTLDLPGFWTGSYQEVRKDLRGRYPKHPWPEDPLGAEATALTKNALARQQAARDR